MDRTSAAFLLGAAVLVAVCGAVPHYIGCTSNNDCGTTECCVIGASRYSMPQCQSHRQVGEPCNPHGQPRNMTVSYPDRSVVELDQVFLSVCPCEPGLLCDHSSGVCSDPLNREGLNDLND